jgi:hypothetical protein
MSDSTSIETLEREMTRVFGATEVLESDGETALVLVEGWPDPVRYRIGAALLTLSGQPDGKGVAPDGDARVCRALEAAGAVVSDEEARS